MSTLKNNVRLTGFLGSDPETRIFADNKNMARVPLATNERYRNADGDWMIDTQWHNLIFWGKNAVFAEKVLKKGIEISVNGRLVNRSYVDKDGATRYVTEVVVTETLLIQKRSHQQAIGDPADPAEQEGADEQDRTAEQEGTDEHLLPEDE